MRRLLWAVIVVFVAVDTGAGSYLWSLLEHKPSLVDSRAERSGTDSAH